MTARRGLQGCPVDVKPIACARCGEWICGGKWDETRCNTHTAILRPLGVTPGAGERAA